MGVFFVMVRTNLVWPRWFTSGSDKAARLAPPHLRRFPNGAAWSVASFNVPGCLTRANHTRKNQSSSDQATKAMRDFFVLASDHFGDREVLKKEFQEFIQQSEDVHDQFDWIDFAARRGQISFGKTLTKFDKRELGGITFRLKQTSKNCASYRFFRDDVGFLPSISLNPSNPDSGSSNTAHKQGIRDVEGKSHTLYIGEKNSDKKNKNKNDLNSLYIGERGNSLNIPTSLQAIFCTQRSDLDRIALDLKEARTWGHDIPPQADFKEPRNLSALSRRRWQIAYLPIYARTCHHIRGTWGHWGTFSYALYGRKKL